MALARCPLAFPGTCSDFQQHSPGIPRACLTDSAQERQRWGFPLSPEPAHSPWGSECAGCPGGWNPRGSAATVGLQLPPLLIWPKSSSLGLCIFIGKKTYITSL